MPVLSTFFAWQTDPSLLLYGSYDPWLVALALAVSVFSSTMGLQAASQAGDMPTKGMRHLTLLAGALALGCGVWAMHFIGMLSFKLCTTVTYNPQLTMLSIAPSALASWVALDLLSRTQVSRLQLWLGGTLVGAGIGAMHYMGMAAMEMAVALRYDPLMFALSIVVAVSLAVLALWVRFGVQDSALGRQSRLVQSLISGSVMGLAISGMHFTGMAAARFIGKPQTQVNTSLQDPVAIALSITLVSMIATVLVAGATGLSRYRQLIERLEKNGARLRAISNSALDGIIVFDSQGIIEDFNPGAQRIYGWAPSEIIGQSVSRLMPPKRKALAEADFPAFLRDASRFIDEERDTDGWHRDGHAIAIRLVIARMPMAGSNLYVAFVSDITERMRMARELQDSEEQFRTLIANIPGISYRCRMEPGWPMVFISDAVEKITGFPAGDFLGPMASVRFTDLVPKEDIAHVASVVRQSLGTTRHFVLEFQLRHRDGSQRWMWGNGSVVRSKDGTVDWIDGVLLDITERRHMEEDLRVAKERAEAAAQARSTFLANMSHEIRTPMNAIMGFTDVVLSGELQAEQRKRLETVHKSARSLLHLLNDILDTSKLEHGAVELEHMDFSLTDLVQQLCAEQSIHANRKHLSLHGEVDANVGEHVKGDPHRLRQILLNLVGNAIKFTEAGGVTVRAQREAEGVHFMVQDTGIGIAPDRLPHIFDAFTQADASMSRRFGGTGLGTTISKQLTELMHGRIWATSEPGQGSIFHVLIPLAHGDATLAQGLSHPAVNMKLPPMRVLAVDDVEQNLELIALLLSKQGHTIVTASNGEEALACAAQGEFDLILMDVQMPVMDGLSACRALRQRETQQGAPRTPVLALSASVLQEDRQAAIEAGMDGFATKPIEMGELMAEMARVTGLALTPVQAGTPIAAGVQANAAIVDLQRGLKLWQDWPPYLQALQRFASEQANWLAGQRPGPVPSGEAAFSEAHRIKGVAANLGLVQIEQAALRVEALVRQEPGADLSATWQALLSSLDAATQEITRLAAHAPGKDSTRVPGPTMDLATLYRKLDQLRAAFLRGECLDELLAQVHEACTPYANATELNALMDAVEVFDFDAAAQRAHSIAEGLLHMESQHAPL
ncbi:MHYT domain-containing protein [Aquabacterium sp.]|uniref:MHYT domain-containing protein n=1 Tax=Aquabacterium sp. TaxID=1872578 RepID=UPI004037F1C5